MDRLIDISSSEYNKLFKLNVESSEGELRRYNNNELIKRYNNPDDYDLEKLEYLIFNYGSKLKTKMPLAPVYIDEQFSGALLKNFNNSYPFGALKNIKNLSVKISKLRVLMSRLIELAKNNLYTTDLHSFNVLLTGNNLDVQIIDVDRNGLEITKQFNKKLYDYMTYEYNKLILEVLFDEYSPIFDHSIKRTIKILELYKIKNYYIDHIIKRKTNFKFSKDFLEYIEKDVKTLNLKY
ncbi:MAG: hypothetical protein E7166_03015 [Firmicutes bacterium]|nr:hypothetical protein [Bacillota bacterium]